MNNTKTNKSRFIRLTVMIAAIAVMTSSIAMGTFAKYATGDNTSSSARVAKWGVTLDITGSNVFVIFLNVVRRNRVPVYENFTLSRKI